MDSKSGNGFVHSTPVPRIYKIASKIAEKLKEGKDSLKNLIYAEKHVNLKTLYALVVDLFKREEIIDEIIGKSQLLVKEPRLNVWLAKILISELLWGKSKMVKGSKPVDTILGYEEILRNLLKDCNDSVKPILKYNISKPRYVRVNTLIISTNEAVNNFRNEGWSLVPFFNKTDYEGFLERISSLKPNEFMTDIHIPDLLIFPPKTEFHNHRAYKKYSIILQDKASCLPVHLLAPPPGSIVLDACAAPGMKTSQIAALMQDKGTIYAVEFNSRREAILRDHVISVASSCVKTMLKDVMQVTDENCPDVEYILVDPSCSGSGITDRIEIEKLDVPSKMARLRKLCNFQAKLLRHTMNAFPKAKRIVYSTCSVNSEENEDVVRQTLETSRNFKLVDAKKALPSWNTKTSASCPEIGDMCIFASPEEDKTNGFFVAVFERLQEGEKNKYLNFELCKSFDKKSRNKNYDDIEETNTEEIDSHNNGKINENNIANEENIGGKKKRKKEIKQSPMKNPIAASPENLHEDQVCLLKKRKKNRSSQDGRNSEVSENTRSNESEAMMPEEKKKKKEKIHKEENEEIYDNSVQHNNTPKKEKKHKKNNKEGDKVSESLTEYSTNDSISCQEKKKKHEKEKNTECVTENLIDDNIDQISNGKKKKKTNNPSRDQDEKSFLESSNCNDSISHKVKKKNIKEDEIKSVDASVVLNHSKEESENIDNSALCDNTPTEKNKKNKGVNKMEAVLDESETVTTNEENKTKKLHKRNKNPDLPMENLEQHEISVDESKEKNKKRKKTSIVTNENSESAEVFKGKKKNKDENSTIESPSEPEIDGELGQMEITKTKKKRKASIGDKVLKEPNEKKIKK